MNTSRCVDLLTYTYYTGQDGSAPHGPNCHKCMNELLNEDKLLDVQTVFVATPTGYIPFAPRALVFNNGMEAPFSMTSIIEDFLVLSCTQCAENIINVLLSEVAKEEICDGPLFVVLQQEDNEVTINNTNRKRSIKMESSPGVDSETSSACSVAKRLKSEPEEGYHSFNSSIPQASNTTSELVDWSYQIDKAPPSNDNWLAAEDSFHKNYDLPFLYGRIPEVVKDPMSCDYGKLITQFWKHQTKKFNRTGKNDRVASLSLLYFANQDMMACKYCNLMFHPEEGFPLIRHLLSKVHFERVAFSGLVFSHSKDFEKLIELSHEDFIGVLPLTVSIPTSRIPFVSETSTNNIMRIEKLLHYLNLLKCSKLIDDGFWQYMLRIYPNLKDINTCSLCETPVSCEQNADDYFNHFLSDSHVKKAMKNRWNLDYNFRRLISHLSSYLKNDGRIEKASEFLKQIKSASKKKYPKNSEEYHPFEMNK